MIDDPHAIAASWPNPRLRTIAELAVAVTEAPWRLTRDHLAAARKAGLSDDDVLHVVLLSSYFGHLNRIADVTAVALDYHVKLQPPAVDPTRPPWPSAPDTLSGRAAIDIARRPETAKAFTEWRHYAFYARNAPLPKRQRVVIARWVASWLGDGSISSPADLTANPLDESLRAVAEVITLAPWQVTNETFAPLRAAGYDDAAIFDVAATTTSAGVFSRADVALAALAHAT